MAFILTPPSYSSGVSNYPLDRLVTETNGTKGKTTWTHDGLNPIVATGTYAGTYLRDGFGDLLGEKTATGSTQWYIQDTLKSIFTSTDTKGALAGQQTDYSDYGQQLANTTYNFGYTGERTDMSANGLINFYARGYLPNVATWVQADPYRGELRLPQSLGRNAYALSRPNSIADLLGYFSFGDALGWAWDNIGPGSAIKECGKQAVSWSCAAEVGMLLPVGKIGKVGKVFKAGDSGTQAVRTGERTVESTITTTRTTTSSIGTSRNISYFTAEQAANRGWRTGDDIYALTRAGNDPAWSTVRALLEE